MSKAKGPASLSRAFHFTRTIKPGLSLIPQVSEHRQGLGCFRIRASRCFEFGSHLSIKAHVRVVLLGRNNCLLERAEPLVRSAILLLSERFFHCVFARDCLLANWSCLQRLRFDALPSSRCPFGRSF